MCLNRSRQKPDPDPNMLAAQIAAALAGVSDIKSQAVAGNYGGDILTDLTVAECRLAAALGRLSTGKSPAPGADGRDRDRPSAARQGQAAARSATGAAGIARGA